MKFLYFLLPSCWTCKYNLRHPHFSDLDRCARNLYTTSNATGLTKEARQTESKCGLMGKWYEKDDVYFDKIMKQAIRIKTNLNNTAL